MSLKHFKELYDIAKTDGFGTALAYDKEVTAERHPKACEAYEEIYEAFEDPFMRDSLCNMFKYVFAGATYFTTKTLIDGFNEVDSSFLSKVYSGVVGEVIKITAAFVGYHFAEQFVRPYRIHRKSELEMLDESGLNDLQALEERIKKIYRPQQEKRFRESEIEVDKIIQENSGIVNSDEELSMLVEARDRLRDVTEKYATDKVKPAKGERQSNYRHTLEGRKAFSDLVERLKYGRIDTNKEWFCKEVEEIVRTIKENMGNDKETYYCGSVEINGVPDLSASEALRAFADVKICDMIREKK